MTTTATGLVVPEHLHAGASVQFYSDMKQVVQHGYVKSVGEGTCQVQVENGPEKTIAWTDLKSA